ncbi:MAG: tetratricopeptide repeat protein [Holosporales bacterium]
MIEKTMRALGAFLILSTSTLAQEQDVDAAVVMEASLDARVSYLEEQLSQLLGRLEEAEHQVRELKAQFELQNAANTPAPASAEGADAAKTAPETGQEKAQTEDKPAAGKSEAGLPEGGAQALYASAMDKLKAKDYEGARGQCKKLLNQFPKDSLTLHAKYCIGESYYRQDNHKQAVSAFADAYKAYRATLKNAKASKGAKDKASFAKAPETLLRLAQSLQALKKKEEACAALDQLDSEFKRQSESVKEAAQKTRKALKCPSE